MNIKVYHKNQEINWRIPKDSFPDIETAFKGDGYYDFEASAFSFKVNRSGLILSVNDQIKIIDSSGTLILGFIDAINDETSNPVEVTVFPQSLKLKDITAGQEVSVGEEVFTDFKTSSYMSVRDIVTKLAKQASLETGWEYQVTNESIPDPQISTNDRLFANVLNEIPLGKISLTEETLELRATDGKLYLITRLNGWSMHTLVSANKWGNTIIVPQKDRKILGISIEKGSWLNKQYSIPESDIKVPWPAPVYDFYQCEYGGITHLDRKELILTTAEIGLSTYIENRYGRPYSALNYENIASDSVIENLLTEMGYSLDKVLAICDTDVFNSYVVVKAHKKYNDIFGRIMLLSIEKTGEFYYKVHYRNKSIMDILKDLSVVTNRYLLIDADNTIHLLPRDTSLGTVEISRTQVLELTRKTSNVDDISISVNRYVENDDGEPSSYGLMIRDNEWSNLENDAQDNFTGTKTEYIIKILGYHAGSCLGKELLISDSSYNLITKAKYDKVKNITEFVTEIYNV